MKEIIRTNGVVNGVFYLLLLNMSAKLTKELGMAPGGEFRRALEEMHQFNGCLLHLGDRPINITLHRALNGLSLWQTMKLIWRLLTSDDKISKEEVEQCKQRDLLEELMKEMTGEFPAFGNVFVQERDIFLCHSLQVAALPTNNGPVRVVGVVGIGHTGGIKEKWGKVDPATIPDILTIPKPSLGVRVAKYAIKYGFLLGITYGIYRVARPRFKLMAL